MAEVQLTAHAPFDGLLSHAPTPVEGTLGAFVSQRTDLQIATVIARTGPRADLADRVRAACGLALPEGPARTAFGRHHALGVGPRTWLLLEESGAPGFADRLAAQLGEAAAVCDQTDGYAVLRLAGRSARGILAKGLAVDLHPRAFDTSRVVVSQCAHIGVTVWQTDDAPTYEIALFRSFAGSFAHWLHESAVEFGYQVRASG